MKALLFVALSAILLTGCINEAADTAEAVAATEESFSKPEQVGVLPDGRPVLMVTHVQPYEHDRHIYFVAGGGTTTNQEVSSGKTTRQQTTYVAPDYVANAAAAAKAEAEKLAEEKRQQAEKLLAEAEVLLQQ